MKYFDISEEVQKYLGGKVDPYSNFGEEDEDYMRYDDMSTDDLLSDDIPAPWEKEKEEENL